MKLSNGSGTRNVSLKPNEGCPTPTFIEGIGLESSLSVAFHGLVKILWRDGR